jgi:hypothetical protein
VVAVMRCGSMLGLCPIDAARTEESLFSNRRNWHG